MEFIDREVIVLSRNGIWLSDGEEITHQPTCRLFSRILRRDDKGFFLQIGQEHKRVTVEDTPYFVVSLEGGMEGNSTQEFKIRLNDESLERLLPESLSYQPGRLTCRVKSGSEEARFLSAPYHEILRGLKEGPDGYYLEIQAKRILLSAAPQTK